MVNSPRAAIRFVICLLGLSPVCLSRGQSQIRETKAGLAASAILDTHPESLLRDANEKRIRELIELLRDQRPTRTDWPGPTAPPTVADDAAKELIFDYGGSALPALIVQIEKETDRAVFAQLARVVGSIGINDKRLVAVLCRRGRSNDADIRRHVIGALAEIGTSSNKANAVLLAALKDPDPNVQLVALLAATKRESPVPGATAILRKMLSDRSLRMVGFSADTGGVEEVRVFAAHAIGRIGRADSRVRDELEEFFDDENEWMRIAAAVAHARLTGSRKGVNVLFEIVRDEGESKFLRAHATQGLTDSSLLAKNDRAVLEKMLRAECDSVMRVKLLRAVVAADPTAKMTILHQYKTSDDWLVRKGAMELLVDEYRKSPKSLFRFIALVQNPKAYWSVKLDAMEAIAGFGRHAKSAVPHLRRVVEIEGAESMDGKAARRAIRAIEAADATSQ